ncbi:MAG: redoxin domain-containing protein [Deltaproteobacteria bacterium]|nr:redoxin domain-containing protein [Deltaproteobacteria bacterium]
MQNEISIHLQLFAKMTNQGYRHVSKIIILYVIFISILCLGQDAYAKEEINIFDRMGVIRIEQTFDAPLFNLTDIDGNKKSLSSYQGKMVMLNFWATW